MDRLSQIFKNMQEVEPSRGLNDLIMQKIALERGKQIKRKIFLSYAGITGSALATLFVVVSLWDSFFQSEFWSMLSLMFSDLMIVAENWKIYAYSLAETFPVANAIAILIPIFGLLAFFSFLLSLKNKNSRNVSIPNRLKFI
jgi:hypothetical protein